MKRRTVLTSVTSILLAGCLTESSPGGSDTSVAKTSTPGTTQARRTTAGRAADTPAPPNLETPNENHCPPFDDDVRRVVCYEDVDSETNLLMTPSKQRIGLPKATVSFELTNETGTTFTTNYYAWSVWKYVDSEWFYVGPQMIPEPAMMLESGGSHTWTLTVDNTILGGAIGGAQGTGEITLPGLGGGTYAFGIDGWFRGQKYDNGTGVATRFELVGDSLSLTPTDDLQVVGRDGDEKHVRAGQASTTYLATRVENPNGETIRKIPEQVIRLTRIRNLLASFEDGVSRVRLDGRDTSFGNSTVLIEYEGRTYRIETAEY
ncbi:hypothetical protein [Haladaptatus caseinilyticus]|uniref:hypothetical protein n=1 Tax=Haladaptatus caseinilyticus TaxID=2993314 RepID=UPI00224AF4F2|nr:hypothetical protein [Haladaptatus caseinilyticus]